MSQKSVVWYFKRFDIALRKAIEEGQVSYYTGYDPTADSLHLGHLSYLDEPSFSTTGHKLMCFVGGVIIGDPSSKMLNVSKQKKLQECLLYSAQLSRFLDFWKCITVEMVNNYDWFGRIALLTSFVMSENTLRSMLDE